MSDHMHNIEKEKLLSLRQHADTLYEVLNESDSWVEKYIKFEEKNKLLSKVKECRRVVRKIRNSIESKPVFALFGASQVGKSYLVKNLLSINGAPLQIQFEHGTFDFLKDINPPGVGAESTGLVTRFTTDYTAINSEFPVRIKLLNAKDLILIFCDSYFSDVKKISNYPTTEQFKDFCDLLESTYRVRPICQSILIEDDILDIKDYFGRNFYRYGHYVKQVSDSDYWVKIGRFIKNIPPEDWSIVFSILWGKNTLISDIFKSLISELKGVDFAEFIYAPHNVVLRGQHEILDVQRIKEIGNSNKSVNILGARGLTCAINLSNLAALSAEITLCIHKKIEEEKLFLKYTDLLDFPGARSRLGLESTGISDSLVPEMFLRGKIAYLFNKYSADYEINNLLFCQNDKQTDVNEIPYLLNDWIGTNIGIDADERERNISNLPVPPLFIIFTFFNNQLKYDSTNDSAGDFKYKWDTRFYRFFEQELVTNSHNWNIDWTKGSRLFKNFYFLRDFKYSADTFLGYEVAGAENGVNSEREEYLLNLKHSFVAHPFVQKFVNDPVDIWENIASVNKDGSDLIIRNLSLSASNFIKTTKYVNLLNDNKQTLKSVLTPLLHSDDLHEKRRSAIHKGTLIQMELNKVFGSNPQLFSDFLRKFMFSENVVYNFLHDNLLPSQNDDFHDHTTLFLAQHKELSAENTPEENLDILKVNFNFNTIEETNNFLFEQNIDINKLFENKHKTTATTLIDGLLHLWDMQLDIGNFEVFINAGLSRNSFEDLVFQIKNTLQNLDFREYLIKLAEYKTSTIQIRRDAEEYLAAVCTNHINEFVFNFGFNFMSDERKNDLREIANGFGLDITNLLYSKPSPSEDDLISLFDFNNNEKSTNVGHNPMVENYNKFLSKIKVAFLSNCGFVNYNVQANSELHHIITEIEHLEFNL